MKKKVISIVLAILLLICGGLVIYGATRKPADSTSNVASTSDQQMAASKEEREAPTAMPEATAEPETTETPTATPEETAEPETTEVPAATPEATKQPEKTAAPTATPAPTVTNPPAQAHTCIWDGGSVTQAATCSSEGVKTYTCTSCGKPKTESLAKTDHSYVTETTPATCTEYGQDRTYCSVCGYEKSKVANSDAPKGHRATDYRVSFGGFEATCTSFGTYDIYCAVCGKCVETDIGVPALGHDLDFHDPSTRIVQEATCTYSEIIDYTCKRCGEIVRVTGVMDPDNHDWVEGTRVVDDWENGGVKEELYYHCSRCNRQKPN